MGGSLIKSSPSQMSEPKSRQISCPVKTDNVPDISRRLSRRRMFVNLSPSSFPFVPPLPLSFLLAPLSRFSLSARYKKYVVAQATAEMHPKIFSTFFFFFFCPPPTVELGGKRCGRGIGSLFISVSKSDLTDAFVAPLPRGRHVALLGC